VVRTTRSIVITWMITTSESERWKLLYTVVHVYRAQTSFRRQGRLSTVPTNLRTERRIQLTLRCKNIWCVNIVQLWQEREWTWQFRVLHTPPSSRCLNVESVLNARAICLATLDDLIVNSRIIGCLINPSL